jgi:hypothetical protein
MAQQNIKVSKSKQKKNYNRKVRGAILNNGDRVLVKIVAYDGKHKITDRWKSEPYIILSQPNKDISVYNVQREDKSGRTRTLHRNLLLLISLIPENRVKGVIAWIQKVPNNDQLSLVVTIIIDSPGSFTQIMR